jgi:uroporphyrinogen-III synthase
MNKTKSEILVERLKELYKEIEIVRRELITETNKEKLKEKQNENNWRNK